MEDYFLYPKRYKVLLTLEKPMCKTKIGKMINTNYSTVYEILKRLEELGLIQPSTLKINKRTKIMVATAKGQALIKILKELISLEKSLSTGNKHYTKIFSENEKGKKWKKTANYKDPFF